MTSKLTREQTQRIIDAADAVISALAGTNDEVHKDDTYKMVRLWDDLNDRHAPPEVVRELARIALAAMDSEPVYQVFEPSDGRWVDVDDEEEMIRLRSIGGETRTLYTAPPSTVVDSEPVAWLWSRDDERDVSLTPPEVDDDAADAIECGWAATPLYRHAQPAKGLELAGWQFKSVNGDWLGLIDEHGKNQAVRDGYEVREVFAMADGVNDRYQVRREHAEWSQATFGNVGPVGPLKHLAKEAIEAAAEPDDLSEWADMQFLMWDAQRRAGITDEQITLAMVEKLAVNKQRSWPEPKEGEPRLHIKEQPAPVVPEKATVGEMPFLGTSEGAYVRGWNDCRAAMLQPLHTIKAAPALCSLSKTGEVLHANSPVIPDGYVMVPKEPTPEMLAVINEAIKSMRGSAATYARVLAAVPQPQNAPQNIPEIIPGWIPVSERMPETDGNYWGWWSESKRQGPVWFIKSETQAQFQSYEITHWMPLPAAPQEVR